MKFHRFDAQLGVLNVSRNANYILTEWCSFEELTRRCVAHLLYY